MKKAWIALPLLLLSGIMISQTPTIQDCAGAIPICQPIYEETRSPLGEGNFPEELPDPFSSSNSCLRELNSIWYTFTVNNSGDFGFILTPNNPTDDYDWALYNITEFDCSEISTEPSMLVSCNAAGGGLCNGATGANGDSEFFTQGASCSDAPVTNLSGRTPFNDFIPVVEGNTYALVVSQFSNDNSGYILDMGISGDIGIFDIIPPEVQNLELNDPCDPSRVRVGFSERITCSSIDATKLVFSGPGGPYNIELVETECTGGAEYENELILTIDPVPAESGEYELFIENNDESNFQDLCTNPLETTRLPIQFAINTVAQVSLGSDTLICPGESYVIDVSQSGMVTYMWEDGSTDPVRTIDGPGDYSISVMSDCGTSSDELRVDVVDLQGLDFDLGDDQVFCSGNQFSIDIGEQIGISYMWSDGSTDLPRSIRETGTYELISSACGETFSDFLNVTFVESDLALDLGPDTVLCIADGDYVLSAQHPDATSYLWSNGSTNPSIVVNASGTYSVEVSDDCETLEDEININVATCIICDFFLPNVFSPNEDGNNDTWMPTTNCNLVDYKMTVFDRWGNLVFTSEIQDEGWDGTYSGKKADNGVYVYFVSYTINEFGEEFEEKTSGSISIIR